LLHVKSQYYYFTGSSRASRIDIVLGKYFARQVSCVPPLRSPHCQSETAYDDGDEDEEEGETEVAVACGSTPPMNVNIRN
tara:strand:+ start:2111 stop:2350 length:240 start_codon:yes stop_codon:yes gene_type:complete